MSPYRSPPASNTSANDKPREDRDLVVVFAVAWLASAAHVLGVLARGETWSGGTTVAAMLLVALPILMFPLSRRRRS